MPRQAERDTVLPDDLPVERTGHAGQVKSKILHDVRSLFFFVASSTRTVTEVMVISTSIFC